MIEGSGSISLTNGSGCGSGRPKNIWILRIRIRMRIWNRNTACLEKRKTYAVIHKLCCADLWNFDTDPDADPYLWLMAPDADPVSFVSDLQGVNNLFFKSFFCLLLEGKFTSIFKDKSLKEVTKFNYTKFTLPWALQWRRVPPACG